MKYLTNAIKKKCTVFLLSDMLDADADGHPRYEDAHKVAAGRHDLSVIKVHDPRERALPNVGIINIKDSESGRSAWVNTSSAAVRRQYSSWMATLSQEEKQLFKRYKVDAVDISTADDYVKGLMALFAKR